ncbi:MAG: hypothetical protein AAF366_14785 [Pseudomonadota bacterium]
MTGRTYLGRLRLADGSDALVAGRPALDAALGADAAFARQASR